jgi:hypothetical protein
VNSPELSPFLEFIAEEYHQHLLEAGNLGKKPRAISWSDDNTFFSQGYHARVTITPCSCGASHKALVGIFHEEKTPSGKTRSQALTLRGLQIPLHDSYTIRTETLPLVHVCPSCLTSKGFK